MTKQEIVFNELQKHNYEYNVYGIRTDNREYQIGDIVADSHAWDAEHFRPFENEFYDGACATGFDMLWYDDDDMETVKKALKVQENYRGEHQYLIAGMSFEYGNDKDEVIIENAIVVAILA